MLAPSLTLDAALRDAHSERERYRFQAAANLAPALLHEMGTPGPRFRAAAEHPRGPAVVQALRHLLDPSQPAPIRGTAAVGLGTLGAPEVLELTAAWLETTADEDDVAYLRESAVMAASYLGRAALDAEVDDAVVARVRARIESALDAAPPDLRYQAATALVQLWGSDAELPLVRALERETHPEVREGLVDAIAYLDPAGPAACDALEAILSGDDGMESIGFDAAVTLAAARRASARPRLMASLDVRHQRDRALEALAALGGGSPAEVERVHAMARRVWLPSVTRVRAAYALARMTPADATDDPGRALLHRLRLHPRAAVREAVRDAFANLDTLARRG